jgi:hypothetical protein
MKELNKKDAEPFSRLPDMLTDMVNGKQIKSIYAVHTNWYTKKKVQNKQISGRFESDKSDYLVSYLTVAFPEMRETQ